MYDKPLLYDIAFGYRDFPSEVDLLLAWFARVTGGRHPASALELAAGPADHAIELSMRGIRAAALDLSPSMCAHARGKAERRRTPLDIYGADMVDFDLHVHFDLAITMIASLAHVYTVDAMVRHLRSVARHLAPGGVYIVEMTHPGQFLTTTPLAGTHWTERRDGIEVETRWGRDDDPWDPISLVREASVEMRVRDAGGAEVVHRDRVRMKEWAATELDAALKLAGALELAERHGAFALDAPFDNSPESWRMISVLRKRAGDEGR